MARSPSVPRPTRTPTDRGARPGRGVQRATPTPAAAQRSGPTPRRRSRLQPRALHPRRHPTASGSKVDAAQHHQHGEGRCEHLEVPSLRARRNEHDHEELVEWWIETLNRPNDDQHDDGDPRGPSLAFRHPRCQRREEGDAPGQVVSVQRRIAGYAGLGGVGDMVATDPVGCWEHEIGRREPTQDFGTDQPYETHSDRRGQETQAEPPPLP